MTPADRRQFLTGAGLAAAACCGLAGCSSAGPGETPSSQAAPTNSQGTSSASPSHVASTTAATPAATGTSPADSASVAAGPSIAKDKVPTGGGAIITDAHVVVTQPEAGTFKAFTSICPHQGCDVARVENNVIICDCHGSKFSAVDGSVEVGPATSPLGPLAVSQQGDSLVVST